MDNDEIAATILDFALPSKERTLWLLRLNIAAYPFCQEKLQHGHLCSFPADTMQGLFEMGRSIYGSNISSMVEEQMAAQSFEVWNWNLLTIDNNFTYIRRSIPSETAKFDFGVSAMEWRIDENTSILVFRGTFSSGDYANIDNWMIDFLLERSTSRMKKAWVHDAGLAWTQELQHRLDQHDDTLDKVEIRAIQNLRKRSFPKELANAIADNSTLQQVVGDLNLQDAKATGYWKLTKYIVDQVATQALAENRTLILTGHSQGGTRAQLASMYLQQTYNMTCPTITFAATGSACMSRLLFDYNSNLLQDVNPFIRHDQMVDYVHPLDPWGNAMLGEDNGGQVCYFGNSSTPLRHFDAAFHYCSQIYGWRGPKLVVNEHKAAYLNDPELKAAFQQCRYFTHNPKAILFALSESLQSNGTTDVGCRDVLVIPESDPQGTCPIGEMSLKEDEVVGLIGVLLIAMAALLLFSCCKSCKRRKRWSRRYNRAFLVDNDIMENAISHDDNAGLEDFHDEFDTEIELSAI